MLLDLGKSVSFFLSMISLYPVAMSAFFEPAAPWQARLMLALPRVAIAACVCFASGLLFSWPSRGNPDAGQALTATLPVRLFLWAIPGIAALFVLGWYTVCGYTGCPGQSEAWM